ncbi:unnamed protein product [Larinioides sclopetarius]|uniref:Uncharacterized protein n=1 Tax=Larinioides sclopetarius TaxID=280406 RepID=A0AAV2BDF0_9ARAC
MAKTSETLDANIPFFHFGELYSCVPGAV